MKICGFCVSNKKILLNIFSLIREIVSNSMSNRFMLKIKDKKPVHKKPARAKPAFYYK